ncbi:MAG: transporter substrate-binding domain-containing protein [Solobacterium sp.]|nr:transporter substrate-binding domain-containing protein [Solobacterium sp.]
MKKLNTLAALTALSLLAGCGSAASEPVTPDTPDVSEPATETTTETVVYRTLDEIKDSGTIRIGVFSDKAPFGYVNENGEYDGYDVYFAERIGQDLGVDIEYVSLDPANRVEFAETGKVDIVLANFTVTAERAEKVDFALPYMKVQLGIVSSEADPINDVSDLEGTGKELIIAKGTTAETYFENNHPDVVLQKYDAYADAYNALLDGRGAGLSTDNTEVLAWAAVNPGFVVNVAALGDVDTIAPAVSKGNTTLLEWINDEIVSLADEEFFLNDYEATLREVYGEESNAYDLIVEGGVID